MSSQRSSLTGRRKMLDSSVCILQILQIISGISFIYYYEDEDRHLSNHNNNSGPGNFLRENKNLQNYEKERIYDEVLEWIKENDAHFKKNGKILYDEENLERIKRFANTPMAYIDERIELNKEVSKSHHKLYHSILLAGLTGFLAILSSQSIIEFFKTFELKYLVLLFLLGIGSIIAVKIHLTYLVLKWIGLLKVIRDSEIEVYYLSKIKEYRKSIRCSGCGKRIPKDSEFCYHCGYGNPDMAK